MKAGTLHIERLLIYQPPFDCINDKATCPACTQHRGDHGVSGGTAVYAVRAEHEGKRYAVSLELFGGHYLPATQQWWRSQGIDPGPAAPRARDLTIHVEHPHGIIVECRILGGPCRADTGSLDAEALFDAHGNHAASADVRGQPETLWIALERCLVEAIFRSTGGAS